MKQEKTAMLSRFVRQSRVCMVLFVASSVYGIGDVLRAADSPEASGPDIGTTTEQSSATSNGKKQGETQQLTNVVVTGVTRLDQASGYEQEQEATNQLNVLSQQAIEQTPYKTVGEAVQLLPGVGVQHDTGEPRFAQIRGTDANLNDILFNGVVLPSYFPGFRAVSIDSIPVGLVSNIDVNKTLLPYMDGEGIGGQFNLEPKSAFDYNGFYAQMNVQGGYVPLRYTPTSFGSFTIADTFKIGEQAKLGILVSGLYDFRRFGIDDLEESYSTPGTAIVDKSIGTYVLRHYTYERMRTGIGTNIDLELDPNNRFYFDFEYGGYNERRIPRYETVYSGLDVTSSANVLPNGSYITTPGNVSVQKSLENSLQRTDSLRSSEEENISSLTST